MKIAIAKPDFHAAGGFEIVVERIAAGLRARGLRLLYDTPRRGTAGSRINFVHPKDAGGVLVELVEPSGHVPPSGESS